MPTLREEHTFRINSQRHLDQLAQKVTTNQPLGTPHGTPHGMQCPTLQCSSTAGLSVRSLCGSPVAKIAMGLS